MSSIITTDDLRAHLNLAEGQDEELLTAKIEAAQAMVAAYVGAELDQDAPAPLKEAVRRLAAELYENRELSVVGERAAELPYGIFDLVGPYREWSF